MVVPHAPTAQSADSTAPPLDVVTPAHHVSAQGLPVQPAPAVTQGSPRRRKPGTAVTAPAKPRHAPVSRPVLGALGHLATAVLSRLPLRVLHGIGASVGRLASLIPNASRHITRVNLALCFPDASPETRRLMERRSLQNLGRAFFELPYLWTARKETLEGLVRTVHGRQYLDAALASGRGLLLSSAHVGSWEFLGLWFSLQQPSVGLYRRPHIRQFNELMLHGRCRFGGRLLDAAPSTLREFLTALRRDESVWLMADQLPISGAGLWSPFFGQPALTATLLPGLAHRTGAAVLMAYAERLPRGRGYDIHIVPVDDDVRSPDTQRAVNALNRGAESLIRRCPEQYLWRYKRFRRTPDGGKSPYKQAAASTGPR